MATATKPQLLNNDEAAEFLRVKPHSLENWRISKRYKLPYHKIGGRVYYDAQDLLAWLESRKVPR